MIFKTTKNTTKNMIFKKYNCHVQVDFIYIYISSLFSHRNDIQNYENT